MSNCTKSSHMSSLGKSSEFPSCLFCSENPFKNQLGEVKIKKKNLSLVSCSQHLKKLSQFSVIRTHLLSTLAHLSNGRGSFPPQ